jgi:hypothetical protein
MSESGLVLLRVSILILRICVHCYVFNVITRTYFSVHTSPFCYTRAAQLFHVQHIYTYVLARTAASTHVAPGNEEFL